jgi:hypothetical protein
MFLTKAEQRAQDKKTEKKATEDPFYFLVDVRDVSGSKSFHFGHACTLCLYIYLASFILLEIERALERIHVCIHPCYTLRFMRYMCSTLLFSSGVLWFQVTNEAHRRTAFAPANQDMIHVPCTSLRKHGRPLRHSRSRYD